MHAFAPLKTDKLQGLLMFSEKIRDKLTIMALLQIQKIRGFFYNSVQINPT